MRKYISRAALAMGVVFAGLLFSGCNVGFNVCWVNCERVVDTSYGKVKGKSDSVINSFWGIPYAAAPVGNLRWQAPQPPVAWSDVLDAGIRYAGCNQWSQPTAVFGPFADEDCLHLNIWTPDKPGPHPVVFWIHGGGLVLGAGTETQYMGKKLARTQNVTVVTLNYRLGPMGFLSLPELSAEQGGRSGNYGMLDQVAALEWVKDEIANFGGDPNNITVFGESAGGLSTCMLMASPLSRDLFQHAMVASGPCGDLWIVSQTEAENHGVTFANKMGCTDSATRLDCLRALTPADIADKLGAPINELFAKDFDQWAFFPYLATDGHFIDDTFTNMLTASSTRQNVMIGAVKDEGSIFVAYRDHPGTTDANYLSTLTSRYPSEDQNALANTYYPLEDFINIGHAMSEIRGDELIFCPTVKTSDLMSQLGYPVYQYHFTEWSNSILKTITYPQQGSNPPPLGVPHSSDVAFIFGATGPTATLETEMQFEVSNAWQDYIGALARSGDPNNAGRAAWPAYNDISREYLTLGEGFATGQDLHADTCAYWNQ